MGWVAMGVAWWMGGGYWEGSGIRGNCIRGANRFPVEFYELLQTLTSA